MSDDRQYQQGMTFYGAGQYAEAIGCLTPLADESSSVDAVMCRFYLGQAHHRLAMELYECRCSREALKHFRAAAQLNPASGGLTGYLAHCYAATRQFEMAAREYESRLAESPDDIETRTRLALSQWKSGNHVNAMATLRDGLRRQPGAAELHYQLGVMLASDDNAEEAAYAFERAIAANPRHIAANERLAQCCAATDRHERAMHYLYQAHQLDPSNANISWQLALLSGALTHQKSTQQVDWVREPAAVIVDEQGLEQLTGVILAEPDFVESFLALPESRVDPEVFSSLASILERALARHPEFADLHYHCSEVQLRVGKISAAIGHAESAVRINTRYAKALILLAQLYGQSDRGAEAVERLDQAIAAGADYPDVHHLLGRMCEKAGDSNRAKTEYARALELNSNYDAAREALVGCAVRTSDSEEMPGCR